MTNFDKIKEEINTMTSEQFADFCHFKPWKQNILCSYLENCTDTNNSTSCKKCIINWLNNEVK